MGINRIVNTDFWDDEKVLDNFSPEDKFFWLFLLTNPKTRQLGIYKLPIKVIQFYTGYSEASIIVLLERFEKAYGMIKYSHETQEVAILNYLRWSIIRGGKPVEDCIKADLAQVKDKELIRLVYSHLGATDGKTTVTLENIFKHIEDNYKAETPKKPKAEKHKYGEHKNVLLADDEYEKLVALENGERAIEYLSGYIAEKGYKAKSHYLSIKRWVFDALKEKDQKAAELQRREKQFKPKKADGSEYANLT